VGSAGQGRKERRVRGAIFQRMQCHQAAR
jgi:hypothetical protein